MNYSYQLLLDVTICLPPFINHSKITHKVLLKQKPQRFCCTKFVLAPVKGFHLVREMQKSTTTKFSK